MLHVCVVEKTINNHNTERHIKMFTKQKHIFTIIKSIIIITIIIVIIIIIMSTHD